MRAKQNKAETTEGVTDDNSNEETELSEMGERTDTENEKERGDAIRYEFRDESCAMYWRYNPTPESSEGAGDPSDLLLARGATLLLVCELFRGRFGASGVVVTVFVLPTQAGRVLVTVDFAVECPSSDVPARRDEGVA